MSKKRPLLKEYELNDISIIKDIYDSNVKLAIKEVRQKLNFSKLNNFAKKIKINLKRLYLTTRE